MMKELNTERDFPYKKELENIQVIKNENFLDQKSNFLKFNNQPRVPTFLFTRHPSTLKVGNNKWATEKSFESPKYQ